jgi:fibro-slime domain-containing protein
MNLRHAVRSVFVVVAVVGVVGVIAIVIAPVARADTISLNVTIRDFCSNTFLVACPPGFSSNPDFERAFGDDRGLFAPGLGAGGNPVVNPAKVFPSSTVTSAAALNQFFLDVAGVNLTTTQLLTLVEAVPGSGLYQFSSGSFFPIDGQLLGNQGQANNFAFTLQLHSTFTYRPGQNFSFSGDDDVWVYINKLLVIDLGGVHPPQAASVNLDTLGLTAGATYDFDLFFAERHTEGSNLNLTTSIVLNTNALPQPGTLALLGLGLACIGAGLRKR